MSSCQLILWTVFLLGSCSLWFLQSFTPSSARLPNSCLIFSCGILYLPLLVAGWSLSDLFDDNSARPQFQNTLQVGPTASWRFYGRVGIPIPPLETLLDYRRKKNVQILFLLLISYHWDRFPLTPSLAPFLPPSLSFLLFWVGFFETGSSTGPELPRYASSPASFYPCVCTHPTVHEWRSQDNIQELVLSFYHVVPGLQVRWSGLVASVFIHWAIFFFFFFLMLKVYFQYFLLKIDFSLI